MRPIDVLAWTDRNGDIHPIRFTDRKDMSVESIKIDFIIKRSMDKRAGNIMHVFNCRTTVEDKTKFYQIKYEVESCLWYLNLNLMIKDDFMRK